MSRVALVTCRVLPEPDPDQGPLLAALAASGLEAELLAWDDPAADPGAFDLCVLRSCWNYPEDPAAFGDWIEAAAARTRLLNPPGAVRWNLHKAYLRELETAGLPVVPTLWAGRGEAVDLAAALAERRWSEVVIKPAISAASYRTRRFPAAGAVAAQAFLDALTAERDAMVQPYLAGIETAGERALVWIDGEVTHAVRKTPRFTGEDEAVSAALPPAPEERSLFGRALAVAPGPLLYARLDLFPGPDGRPLVSELEIMEPSLFLVQHPPALARFAAAIRRRAREAPTFPET